MLFTSFIPFLMAVAIAAPTPVAMQQSENRDLASFEAGLSADLGLTGTLCPTIVECVAALGPSVVGCAAAVIELGANPIADAACIAAAINAGINTPAACAGCF